MHSAWRGVFYEEEVGGLPQTLNVPRLLSSFSGFMLKLTKSWVGPGNRLDLC